MGFARRRLSRKRNREDDDDSYVGGDDGRGRKSHNWRRVRRVYDFSNDPESFTYGQFFGGDFDQRVNTTVVQLDKQLNPFNPMAINTITAHCNVGATNINTSNVTYQLQGQVSQITPAAGAPAEGFFNFWFNLNAVPNTSYYTALWDQYRIRAVEVKFMSKFNMITANTVAAGTQMGLLVASIDTTNPAVPTGLNALRQQRCVKMIEAWDSCSLLVKPQLQSYSSNDFNTGTALAVIIEDGEEWLDSAYPNISYYGVSGSLTQCNASTIVPIWDVICIYHLEFRGVNTLG